MNLNYSKKEIRSIKKKIEKPKLFTSGLFSFQFLPLATELENFFSSKSFLFIVVVFQTHSKITPQRGKIIFSTSKYLPALGLKGSSLLCFSGLLISFLLYYRCQLKSQKALLAVNVFEYLGKGNSLG